MNRKNLTTLAEILGIALIIACTYAETDWKLAGIVLGIALVAIGVTQA